MSMSRRQALSYAAASVGLVALTGCAPQRDERATTADPEPTVSPIGSPIIYSTDLSHPHIDPDDHIDLAVAHGLDLDVRLIVLDQHAEIGSVPGVRPVAQLNHLTGRAWPAQDGQPAKLASLADVGADPAQQDAARAILTTLASSTEPVVVVIVGSCRDVAAAFNLDPVLFEDMVARIVVYAGDASAPGVEYNVGLDPLAFLRLMGSGVPISWVPCFDGGTWQAGTRSSFVQTTMSELFPLDLPPEVLRYFTYMHERSDADPLAWLERPSTPAELTALRSGLRNLWVGPLLGHLGPEPVVWNGRTVATYEPVTARFHVTGALDPTGSVETRVDQLHVTDPAAFDEFMVTGTVDALRSIRLA